MRGTPERIAHYIIESEIGRGGMSVVYRALDTRRQRVVAIKVLKSLLAQEQDFVQRFVNEALWLSRIQHPHIVPIEDAGEENGLYYLVMPLIPGQSLADLLHERKALPLDQVVRIVRDVASALDAAHAQSIIHRDIKPSNIMIVDNRALVLDFGIGRVLNFGTLNWQSGSIGTPTFMAPEQFSGEQLGPWTDVYALGVTTYLMITGKLPFEGHTPHELMHHHMNTPVPPLPASIRSDYPRLQSVLEGALAKLPSERYRSAGTFATQLENAISTKKTQTDLISTPVKTPAPRPNPQPVPPSPPRISPPPKPQWPRFRPLPRPGKISFSPRYIWLMLAILIGGSALLLTTLSIMWNTATSTEHVVTPNILSPTSQPVAVLATTRTPTPLPTQPPVPTPIPHSKQHSAFATSTPLATLTPTSTPTPTPAAESNTTAGIIQGQIGILGQGEFADRAVRLLVPDSRQDARYAVPFEWVYNGKLPPGETFHVVIMAPDGRQYEPPSCTGALKTGSNEVWRCDIPPNEIGDQLGFYVWWLILKRDGAIVAHSPDSRTFEWFMPQMP